MTHPFRLRFTAISPLLLAMSAALPLSASAQDAGFYVGLGAGRVTADINTPSIGVGLTSGGYRYDQLSTSERDNHFKVLGGYSFNQNFALEGSYINLGSFDFDSTTLPAATLNGKAGRISGYAFDVVGTLPLTEQWSAFARLGLNNAKVNERFSGTAVRTGLVNDSQRGWNEHYGVGVRYAVNEVLSLQAEVERYGLEDTRMLQNEVETFTIGLVYRFGAPRAAAPAPAPVAAAPAPAPTPAPAPAPRLPIELTLNAATLFDFDRTEIKQEGREALDKLVADMRTLDYELVLVTGHTDRIGTREYNLDLSQRRADAVKNYLVEAGIPAARITSRGVNSDEPVTRPEDCRGTGSAAAQIACLQPDRRVVILVTGTREQ